MAKKKSGTVPKYNQQVNLFGDKLPTFNIGFLKRYDQYP